MLIRPHALDRLAARGVKVPPYAPITLARNGAEVDEFCELQIEPRVRLAPESFDPKSGGLCEVCGRVQARLVRALADATTIPNDIDLVRPQNYPGLILASERFVEATKAEELRGGEVRELDDYV